MFGKKKTIPAFHYEGLPDFVTDYPCTVEVTENSIVIQKKKPEVTVSLPVDKILAVSPMQEKDFMMKYHGHSDVRKIVGSKRHFVVFDYVSQSGENKYFALWAPTHQAMALIGLQKIKSNDAPSSYTL